MVDFPDAGRPVIQTAKAAWFKSPTITVHFFGIEAIGRQDRPRECNQFYPDSVRESRIPYRAGHHQRAKGVIRRDHTQDFVIATFSYVSVPKSQKQTLERSFQ